MTEADRLLQEALAIPLVKVQRPALTVATRNDDPRFLRERASRAAREAAEAEEAELARLREDRAAERAQKLAAFEARHWHAVEQKFHEQEARRIEETYRGFHSRGD
jgi:hypothetical protein